MTVTGAQLGQRLVIISGPLVPVDIRWLVGDAVLFIDLLEDVKQPELKGQPVPVELCDAVELENLPELEDERIPELDPRVGAVTPVRMDLLLVREEELLVRAVTPVRMEVVDLLLLAEEEPPAVTVTTTKLGGFNDCVDASLARAKATRAVFKLIFMAASDGRA